MKELKSYNSYNEYKKVEESVKEWFSHQFSGLELVFEPQLEIMQTDTLRVFTKERVYQIVELVNSKIGEELEKQADRIYLTERLERIWKKHPRFNPKVEKLEDIKNNKQFLKYLDELVIRNKNVQSV